jgi:thioredoxin reductase (NADPH)
LRAEVAAVEAMKKPKVEFLLNSVVKEIKGDSSVRSVILENRKSGEVTTLEVDGVFVQVGEEPNTKLVREAGVAVDKDGYIIVDAHQGTNLPTVFAAGDVTNGSVKQVATAVGQAAVAATEAFGYIKRPYYYNR